jgi:hypothetical protein
MDEIVIFGTDVRPRTYSLGPAPRIGRFALQTESLRHSGVFLRAHLSCQVAKRSRESIELSHYTSKEKRKCTSGVTSDKGCRFSRAAGRQRSVGN